MNGPGTSWAGTWCRARRALLGAWALLAACTPIPGVGEHNGSVAQKPGSCEHDGDCVVHSSCLSVQCMAGSCVERPEPEGTELADDQQLSGDCSRWVCDGRGQARKRPDDSDVPRSDGNPCRKLGCHDGAASNEDQPDGTSCNGSGSCQSGSCSVCAEGAECSRSGDCSIFRWRCLPTGPDCQDTFVARPTQSCAPGKICDGGTCVPCVVGAECPSTRPCHTGRVISCTSGVMCDEQPMSGPSCGTDSAGKPQFCVNGACLRACREEPCATAADACHENRWDCSEGAAPSCIEVTREDGATCGESGHCHAGSCAPRALVNGDFASGTAGWTATEDGARFLVAPDPGNNGLRSVSTSPDGRSSGGAARGTLTQIFSVPHDALSLHFVVSGGHAHVRLKDMAGNVVRDCTGLDSSDLRIPVSWDLTGLRDASLVLAIEDDVTSGDWAFITVSGFDVLRDVDTPLRNPQFLQGLDGWAASGEGQRFEVIDPYNYYSGPNVNTDGATMYGQRRSISTYTHSAGETTASSTQGSLSQSFVVPADAVALRFNVHGGTGGRIQLFSQDQALYSVTGPDDDNLRVLVNWPLQSQRGKSVRLVIVDNSSIPPYGYIGTTGFDLLTSYNGP